MTESTYNVIKPDNGVAIKAWTKGVPLEDAARQQLLNVAQLPFIYKWVAAMPDVHWGIGATVGSVIPTRGAIILAAVVSTPMRHRLLNRRANAVQVVRQIIGVKISLQCHHAATNVHAD